MPPKKRTYAECDNPSLNLNLKKLKKSVSDDSEKVSDTASTENCVTQIEYCTNDNTVSLTSSPLSVQLPISERLLLIEQELCQKLNSINFRSSIEYVYNPIIYAFEVHAMYVKNYCNGYKKILFLGMNPGPWGMSQTGVPFGEISMVRDWLKLSGFVGKPPREHPDRKVTGFDCTRSEVSGKRLWGLFREMCGTPQNFFKHCYVHNYCPIALMDRKGKNITPAELKGEEQKLLYELCDEALTSIIQLLNVEIVVGIGRFAEKRAQIAVRTAKLSVLWISHPSPRSVGNQNWDEKTKKRLYDLELAQYFSN
ncbi:hypothetical protein KPH14_012465 [Odynerus spinipes]|uniref:Uracil-DNA glycosylase-like domain-containing protein n=1 Tax=Odynerus spinipes TaxID=1348599 RepID=A0AAD9VMT2_9HYME|nr:hypothetical protein KPH14_012465 [Odynerus spinipes]